MPKNHLAVVLAAAFLAILWVCALAVAFFPGTAALYLVAFGTTVIICALEWLRRGVVRS